MEQERAATKRRASFGRTARLAKEGRQEAAAEKAAAERKVEREKADQQRKADATKAAEQRIALARKKAEQRRLERHKANVLQAFNRTAEDRKAQAARAEEQRQAEARKADDQKRQASQDQKQREAEAYVVQQQKRQQAEQQQEHRRQTDRLRAEHKAERLGFRQREAGGLTQHARQVRNIDIAERRALEALDQQRKSLAGRAVSLVRGGKHFERQAQAIRDQHETSRWQKHREHEARKDNQFWAEQASRMRHVVERKDIAQRHQAESRDLAQAQDRTRPEQIKDRVQVVEIIKELERQQPREHERVAATFGRAAGNARGR